MSTFQFRQITMPSADLNGTSTLPMLEGIIKERKAPKSSLGEDDGLFVGYGAVDAPFPYQAHDRYGRELNEQKYSAVFLENEHLRALFMPQFGGKLWSLFDKDRGRELLFSNPVVRFGNLAIRNAWNSGGVEFNVGVFGHNPFTVDTLFTAKGSMEDGTPFLRMYEFERIRGLVYQMDFWLPDGSRLLFARMRIVNPNTDAAVMYWWSNMAVPSGKGARLIVPSDEAYTSDEPKGMYRTHIPYTDGIDISYSENIPTSRDYFFRIENGRRRYIAYVDEGGNGMIQTSTSRLKSRKLFVWGQGQGGEKWQSFLSGNGCDGKYIELQAGVANTQWEHVPMPPKTVWEWLEAYGPVSLDPARAHDADYHTAQRDAEEKLDGIITEGTLENMLKETRAMSIKPAGEMLLYGSGWGALENLRRTFSGEAPLPAHLDFGKIGPEQEQWAFLLKNGFMETPCAQTAPKSWMKQADWVRMMEKAVDGPDQFNWYTWMHLGCAYLSSRQFRLAKEALEMSMRRKPNCWAMFALACMESAEGNQEKSAQMMLSAAGMNPDDRSIACAAASALHEAGMHGSIVEFVSKMPESVAKLGRIRLYLAYALLKTGDADRAKKLLYADGGLSVADIREGEVSVTELWYETEEALAKKEGRTFDRERAEPPSLFDFRMFAKKKAGRSGENTEKE